MERDRIRRELSQFGYQVVPDKELPLQGPKLIETVNEYLRQARLSVHLIGAHYGIVPELEDRSIVRIQHDLAEARSHNSQFKRLIWLPSDLKDAKSREELATLKGHKLDVNSVFFSSDGLTIVSGSADRTVRLWRGATDEEVARQRNK